MGAKFPVMLDGVERIFGAFVVTLLTALLSDAANWQDVLKLDNWKGWAFAGLAAAFTALKALIGSWVGRQNGKATSASLAPAVKLQPVNE